MSDMQIQQVLGQMRALAARSPAPAPMTEGPAAPGFGEVLQKSLQAVSTQQAEASRMAEAFQRNDPAVSLPDVMVSMQKSSLAFEATVQVRNRLLQAYQDIMNMQV